MDRALNLAVLFKLRPEYETEVFEYWKSEVHKLVGVVPGV